MHLRSDENLQSQAIAITAHLILQSVLVARARCSTRATVRTDRPDCAELVARFLGADRLANQSEYERLRYAHDREFEVRVSGGMDPSAGADYADPEQIARDTGQGRIDGGSWEFLLSAFDLKRCCASDTSSCTVSGSTAQARPSQARPSQARPYQVRPSQVRAGALSRNMAARRVS